MNYYEMETSIGHCIFKDEEPVTKCYNRPEDALVEWLRKHDLNEARDYEIAIGNLDDIGFEPTHWRHLDNYIEEVL